MKFELSGLFSNVSDAGQRVRERASQALGLSKPQAEKTEGSIASAAQQWPAGQRMISASELAAEIDRDAARLREIRLAAGPEPQYDASHMRVPRVSLSEVAQGLNGRVIGSRNNNPK